MITLLEVDGFRSLVEFKLKFRPGLNLLVGTNGSGKSNIISFLAFIFDATTSNLPQAVANLGGSGTVFRKHGENEYHSQIAARVKGYITRDDHHNNSNRHRRNTEISQTKPAKSVMHYEYIFTVQLSDDRENVYFAEQSLKLHICSKSAHIEKINEWDFVAQVTGNPDGSTRCNRIRATGEFEKENKRARRPNVTDVRNEDWKKEFEERLKSDYSLIPTSFLFIPADFMQKLFEDFQRRIIFNPHPTQIRMQEDSAKSPGIHPDGSGLYSSLLALKRSRSKLATRHGFLGVLIFGRSEPAFDPKIKLDRLIEFFQLAYPTMSSLDVTNDQFENTIRVRVTLQGKDTPQIPLAALSDGTLKWMSFVTAIFTNDSLLAIEEPENFVHLAIQREAVKIVRDQVHNEAVILMSSHSETIINSAEPEEIVVVSMNKGRTVAKRVRRSSKIKELINGTGFGLGFYYLSGALDDA